MATNRYGVDTSYFHNWIRRSLTDLSDYTSSELARELARMAKAAEPTVLYEPEFSSHISDELQTLKNVLIEMKSKLEQYQLIYGNSAEGAGMPEFEIYTQVEAAFHSLVKMLEGKV